MMIKRHTHVLVVEDNTIDAFLTQAALEECDATIKVASVSEGTVALNYLLKTGTFQNAPTPDLILLDLNMPVMDGLEFLKLIKQNPQLKHIPIVILTTSDNERDIKQTFQFQAVAYLNKPLASQEILPILENLALFTPKVPTTPNNHL